MKFHLQIDGLDELIDWAGSVKDFRAIARKPLRAAAKDVAAREKPLLRSKEGRRAVGVSVKNAPGGLEATIGPRAKNRAGYLADLFQETGTGEHGPKHRPFGPKGRTWSNKLGARGRHKAAVSFTIGSDRFARYSVKGAKPRPWLDEAKRYAAHQVPKALHEGIAEAMRNA